MPESSSVFNAGMSSDNSPIYQDKSTYVDALNIEVINDESQGSIAISNSKGNKFQIAIPNVSNIYRLSIIATSGNTSITINGIVSATNFTATTSTVYKDLYDFILADANFDFSKFNVYYNNNKVVIVPKNTFTLTVSVTGTPLSSSIYIPAQSNLQIIGYGVINDDVYLFTTSCIIQDPQNSLTDGYGQIWKLSYNNITFATTTLDLIYSAKLNFTTYFNIPQTGVVPRYENGGIQRLYWTDFYNKVRTINVVDPQVFALDVSLLDLIPSADFDIPILSEIHPGGVQTLKVGVYQLAYRFTNSNGPITGFSALSNLVYVTTRDEGISIITSTTNNFADYAGDPFNTDTTKIISWTINNLDPDFERIEAVVLVREKLNDPPTIYSFLDESISGRESLVITVDGDILKSTDTFTLTLSEFLTLNGYFTHAKTLSTKDNRLIAGNLRVASLDLNYDARAFRAKTSGADNIYLTNTGVETLYNSTTARALDESKDTINNYQGVNAGYYKPNTAILGGSGTNISYEFISVAVKADTGNGSATGSSFDLGIHQVYPFRTTANDVAPSTPKLNLNVFSSDVDNNDVLQEYPLALPQVTYEDMKYPQYNALYWGYQQNEIYRIGIQFYDKAKNPYFVKWIGDIKFPDITDICPAANNLYEDGTQTGETTFVKSFAKNRNFPAAPYTAWITQLGLKLSINIPADLTKIISGYSIVRVKREESDKTVIAEGIIPSVGDVQIPNNYHTPDPSASSFLNAYTLAEKQVCFFITPNVLGSGLAEARIGDTLNIRKAFDSVSTLNTTDLGGAVDPYTIYRLYSEIATASQSKTITQSLPLGIAGIGTALNGYTVNNRDSNNVSLGDFCWFFSLNSPLNAGTYAGATYKLYATVDRVLTNQYGGATYGDRANNEYILCSHFRSVKTKGTAYSDTSLIYGGDCMNYDIDLERAIKHWGGSSPTKLSTTFIFPSGACLNPGFRNGAFVNRTLQFDSSSNGTASQTETYDLNSVYSSQNDIVKFFPKPDPFIENTIFNNRFRISEIKINGELSDSWRDFKVNNYWDVEGTYGGINSSLIMNDKLYFWQDRAFGILAINPRVLVTDINNNSALQVGTGLPIQRHDYISTVIGTKHQGSTICSYQKLYFYDTNTKKIYTFDGSSGIDPFSDVKGQYSFLSKNLSGQIQNIDKPVYFDLSLGVNGVTATYDYKRHKALFTFHSAISAEEQNSFTLAINELTDVFTTFYSFTPRIYVNDGKFIFSTNPTSDITLKNIYIHDLGNYGNYYGSLKTSYIKFIINDSPQFTKVFDNILWDTQAKDAITNVNMNTHTWDKIRITNDYQNTDVIPLILNTNIKRKERTWQLPIPRNRVLYSGTSSPNIFTDLATSDKPFGERIRDKYISVELTYDNLNNNQLITNDIRCSYRPSPR